MSNLHHLIGRTFGGLISHLDAGRGLIELRGFHPSASTSRVRRSDAIQYGRIRFE